jgi:hypothetical protein
LLANLEGQRAAEAVPITLSHPAILPPIGQGMVGVGEWLWPCVRPGDAD